MAQKLSATARRAKASKDKAYAISTTKKAAITTKLNIDNG